MKRYNKKRGVAQLGTAVEDCEKSVETSKGVISKATGDYNK